MPTTYKDIDKLNKIDALPALMIGQIREEIEADSNFKYFSQKLLDSGGGYGIILLSQKKAVLNELNPADFPETAGQWLKLRKHVKAGGFDGLVAGIENYGWSKLGTATREERDAFISEAVSREKNCKFGEKFSKKFMKMAPYAFLALGVFNVYNTFKGH